MTDAIAGVSWRPAQVPFSARFGTARGTIDYRETVLLALRGTNGKVGYGEATPWPSFGQGTARDAALRLAEWAPRLVGRNLDEWTKLSSNFAIEEPGGAAARCALDLAIHDLGGKVARLPLARLYGDAAAAVPVNAVIGACVAGEAAKRARAAVDAGYRCVKVKVAAGALAEDEERVAAVRGAIGPVTILRLDANGGWTAEEALAAIRRLARYDVELIEEPVGSGGFQALARIRRAVDTPIAVDESVRDEASAKRAIEAGAADFLVVKPMVVGGLAAGRAIVALALAAGLGVLVTTTLGFGFETAAALHLAAGLPARTLAHGLATAPLLANDFTGGQPIVRGGLMALPAAPGLGVTLDCQALARYAVGPVTHVPMLDARAGRAAGIGECDPL